MRNSKKAVLISPSYVLTHDSGSLLQQLGVLPSSLRDYAATGFHEDCRALKRIFEGFAYHTLDGTVAAKDVVRELDWLFSTDTAVAVLVFCGHGVNELNTLNGTMVLSMAQRLSAYTVLSSICKNAFTGTFIQVLNMCASGGNAVSQEEVCPIGQSRIDRESFLAQNYVTPFYHGITICATGSFGKTSCDKHGSRFVEALSTLLSTKRDLDYFLLEEALGAVWKGGVVKLSPCFFTGIFGEPVKEQASNAVEYSTESEDMWV